MIIAYIYHKDLSVIDKNILLLERRVIWEKERLTLYSFSCINILNLWIQTPYSTTSNKQKNNNWNSYSWFLFIRIAILNRLVIPIVLAEYALRFLYPSKSINHCSVCSMPYLASYKLFENYLRRRSRLGSIATCLLNLTSFLLCRHAWEGIVVLLEFQILSLEVTHVGVLSRHWLFRQDACHQIMMASFYLEMRCTRLNSVLTL